MIATINRVMTGVSVRTRIVVLALIPVVGFLANGIAYFSGEADVERAFTTANRAYELAEVSREFRTALISLRVRTRDFVGRPSDDLMHSFEVAHETAVRTLGTIENAVDKPTRQKLAPLKTQLEEIAVQFDNLARNQKILGFTEESGTRAQMTKSAAAVERFLHEDMSWMSEADARNLMIPLLTMRRYESEY